MCAKKNSNVSKDNKNKKTNQRGLHQKTPVAPKANKEYKDSVFRDLFSNVPNFKENFLSLYNMVKGSNITDSSSIQKVELKNVFYNGVVNDISMKIGSNYVVLIEQQSTKNPNMPVRFLEYLSALLPQVVKTDMVKYSEKKQEIPFPEFYMIYNGNKPYNGPNELLLSELYPAQTKIGYTNNFPLEIRVKVINMSIEENSTNPVDQEIMNSIKNDPVVYGYYKLVKYVEFYKKQAFLNAKEGKISKSFAEEFIQQAIDRCIEEGILADYLRQYKKEVLSMIFESYDLQKHLEVNNLDHKKEIDELKSEMAEKDAKHATEMAKKDAKHATEMAEKDAVISEQAAQMAEKDIHTATDLILGNVSDELIIKVAHITPEKLEELKLQLKK